MAASAILALQLDQSLRNWLDKLAKSTKRSRSFLAAEVIKCLIIRYCTYGAMYLVTAVKTSGARFPSVSLGTSAWLGCLF
jgi:hypothetical protein